MDEMPDLFSKVGPLPAWAWGAIVVGGYLAYRSYSAKTLAAATTTPTTDTSSLDPTTTPDLTSSLDPSLAGYNYNDVLNGTYGGSVGLGEASPVLNTASGTQYSYATNQQWGLYVVNQLTSMGVSGVLAVDAITKYLAGQVLSPQETEVVNQAIGKFGAPPLPLPAQGILPTGGGFTPNAETRPITGVENTVPSGPWGLSFPHYTKQPVPLPSQDASWPGG